VFSSFSIQGSTVESAIRRYNDPDIKWSTQGMMRLSPEAMKRLFHPTIEKIKMTIGEVLNSPEVKGIQYLFLVGGFAESPILQHEIRRAFSSILKVIIPQDVSLTILKGLFLDLLIVLSRQLMSFPFQVLFSSVLIQRLLMFVVHG